LHELLIRILAYFQCGDYNLYMSTTSYEKLYSLLESGHVYRREVLTSLSKAVDRDLMQLVQKGLLEKIAAGLYYKPAMSRFGPLPPSDEELIHNFLRDDSFLLYSWNDYNVLRLGLTQLYHRQVVYNRKRHGIFSLGSKSFSFRRPARGFPEKLSKEFLLVDLVNNLTELAEDTERVKASIKKNLSSFNQKKLAENVKKYAKVATLNFFKEITH